jgi:hypothetical protein
MAQPSFNGPFAGTDLRQGNPSTSAQNVARNFRPRPNFVTRPGELGNLVASVVAMEDIACLGHIVGLNQETSIVVYYIYTMLCLELRWT